MCREVEQIEQPCGLKGKGCKVNSLGKLKCHWCYQHFHDDGFHGGISVRRGRTEHVLDLLRLPPLAVDAGVVSDRVDEVESISTPTPALARGPAGGAGDCDTSSASNVKPAAVPVSSVAAAVCWFRANVWGNLS